MYRRYVVILLLVISAVYYGCSQERTDKSQTLAIINDYHLSLQDFQRQLAEELEFNPDVKLNNEVKKQFLDEIVRKEILIQQAKNMGLDQQDKFIRAIERYWESTLVRNLIELKSEEIIRRILISEEEIKAYYSNMDKKAHEVLPLETYRDHIRQILKEQKKTRMLNEWINALKQNSKIEINKELLEKS